MRSGNRIVNWAITAGGNQRKTQAQKDKRPLWGPLVLFCAVDGTWPLSWIFYFFLDMLGIIKYLTPSAPTRALG